jgi:hypothetical protein
MQQLLSCSRYQCQRTRFHGYMRLFSRFALLTLFLAAHTFAQQCYASHTSSGPQCLPGADCSTVEVMVPRVQLEIVGASAVTAQLSPDDRAAFEHLLGNALASTTAVQWATREFAARMRRVVVGAAGINGTSAQDAVMKAFAPPG